MRRATSSIDRRSRSRSLRRSPALLPAVAIGLVALVLAWLAWAAWGPRSSTTSEEWGPLAVSRHPTGGDTALTSGVLRVSDQCVVLELPDGGVALVVWPGSQTEWDAADGRIRFHKPDGSVTELRDGQQVSLAGSGTLFDGDQPAEATSRDVWMASIDWAAEPDPDCPIDSSWSVGDVLVDS